MSTVRPQRRLAATRFESKYAVAAWIAFEPYARREDADHLAEGLRKAGLPE